jgi:hypothetical protein
MKKSFVFIIIALIISSCAGAPESPESDLIDALSDKAAAAPVETVIPESPELAVLPDEAETVEMAEEIPPESVPGEPENMESALAELPAAQDEYVESAAVPEDGFEVIPEVVLEVIQEVIPEVVQEVVPKVVQVVISDVVPEVVQKVTPEIIPELVAKPEETVVAMEIQPPPVVVAPPVVEVPVLTAPPAEAPVIADSQISQVLPPAEEEEGQPVVIPAPPLSEQTGPLPALSGQYGERELPPGTYSRTVQVMTGQLIEIPFRGSGWLYLGEAYSRRGVVYESRRTDPEGQSFIFRADVAGDYALKFYRQDFARNYILNDQVRVIVSETIGGVAGSSAAANRSRVVADPRWPSPSEEAQAFRSDIRPASPTGSTVPANTVSAVNSGTVARDTATPPVVPVQPTQPAQPTQPERIAALVSPRDEGVVDVQPSALAVEVAATPSVPTDPPPFAADEFLKQAKEEFDATRVASAISLLDQYSLFYPPEGTISDELYWLYGQFYEANSPSRNILLSLDYYRRLINEYPQSSRCNDAYRRISYLERFYINNR